MKFFNAKEIHDSLFPEDCTQNHYNEFLLAVISRFPIFMRTYNGLFTLDSDWMVEDSLALDEVIFYFDKEAVEKLQRPLYAAWVYGDINPYALAADSPEWKICSKFVTEELNFDMPCMRYKRARDWIDSLLG